MDLKDVAAKLALFLPVVVAAVLWINAMRKPGMNPIIRFVHNTFQEAVAFLTKRKLVECYCCKRKWVQSDKHTGGNGWQCKRCVSLTKEESHQVVQHRCACKKHPFQRITVRGECFSCRTEAWEHQHRRPPSKRTLGLVMLHGMRWFPTLMDDHDGWKGKKLELDLLLEQRKVRWFVYVKFYVDKRGKIIPLVVGKSGSTLVNASGCDVNFSTSVEDGPARRFLAENNLKWHLNWILVRSFRSERKAYAVESYLQRKYNLYGS